MRVSSILFGLSAMGATLTAAAPTSSLAGNMFEERAGACTSPLQRKEWRTLGLLERGETLE